MFKFLIFKKKILFSLCLILLLSCRPSYHKNLADRSVINIQNAKCDFNRIKVVDYVGDSILFVSEYLSKKNNLVLRVPRFSCGSCVTREISNLSDFTVDELNLFNEVIILYDLSKHRFFSARVRSYEDLPFSFYNYPHVLLDQDTLKKPYYMIVESNGVVKSIYMVDKNDNDASIAFLSHFINLD